MKADPDPDRASTGQKPVAWVIPYRAEVTRRKAVMNSVVCPVRIATISTLISQKAMNGEIKSREYLIVV